MSDEEMCPNCLTPWKCNGPHEDRPEHTAREAHPDTMIGRK